MALPTTFFHLARMWFGALRAEERRREPAGGLSSADLSHEVDQAVEHRRAQPAPDHPTLVNACGRLRLAIKRHAERPMTNTLLDVQTWKDEVGKALRSIEQQSNREHAGDQARRRVEDPNPQLEMFATGGR